MSKLDKIVKTIKSKLPNTEIKLDEPLKNHITFKIGGPVSAMIFPENTDNMTAVFDILNENKITPLIIGNGSNILASDSRLEIIALSTSRLTDISLIDSEILCSEECMGIKADAGVLLSNLAVFACENGLAGLEFVHGIPGTVGGAVVMNAGAYGGEIKDVIFETIAYNAKKGVLTLTAADNDFSYRHSRFSDNDDILLSTIFKLKKSDSAEIKKTMEDLYKRRNKSQPLEFASSGSTFKRPKEGYSAALIEQAGLKGYSVGGAQVSEKHSGFIINRGNATFFDVIAIIEHVQEVVYKQTGIILEPEVEIIKEQ